jgi:hypothetical protein
MIVTVFRSRLKPGVKDDYVALVDRMAALAETMPGYISHKGFFADDGERVTIVEFEHEAVSARGGLIRSTWQRKDWRARNITPSITSRCARSIARRSSRRRNPLNWWPPQRWHRVDHGA